MRYASVLNDAIFTSLRHINLKSIWINFIHQIMEDCNAETSSPML